MGTVMSLYNIFDEELDTWDEKSIRAKYLVAKQIEDSKKIKLRSVEGEDFYSELKNHFENKKKKMKKAKR